MKIGVLGTGDVGQAIGTGLAKMGHDVKMGSRDAKNAKAVDWAKKTGKKASVGTFADAAKHGELLFNCTMGAGSLDALKAAGAANLKGKVLVDISNPLDFSKGMPPMSFVPSGDSLAERIQRAAPDAKVVKALNTLTAPLMLNPSLLGGGDHDLILCGDDAGAKKQVEKILKDAGWKTIHDLGGLAAARGMEAYVLLWVQFYGKFQSPMFNLRIVR